MVMIAKTQLLVVVVTCFIGRIVASSLHTAAENHLQQALDRAAAFYLPVNVSPTSPCGKAINTLKLALVATDNSSLWAKKIVDSWGKTTDGVLIGHAFNGMYDECVSAASPMGDIKGQHCRVYTFGGEDKYSSPVQGVGKMDYFSVLRKLVTKPRANLPTTAPAGDTVYDTCIPSVCTQEELQTSLYQKLIPRGLSAFVTECSNKLSEEEFTTADVVFVSAVTFLLSLIICTSFIDVFLQSIHSELLSKGVLRYLLVFSAYTNLSKILQVTPTTSSPTNITCLHAMRTLSMTWVIWCHQQTVPFLNFANIILFLTKFDGILAQAIINGYPSVDTFFFLSGLLVSYSVLRELKRSGGRFNILIFYFHRYIRLVPSILIVVGLFGTVSRFLVRGPLSFVMNLYMYPVCRDKWWKDVTFVDNFFTDTGVCLGQVWYVAADMQLYLVAPLILLPLYFFKRFGTAWLFLVTSASTIIPAAIIYANNLPPFTVMGIPQELSTNYFKLVYLPFWTRASPWLAGAWLGYIFFRQGGVRYQMKGIVVTLGWTLAAITGLLVVFGMYNYNQVFNPAPYELMTSLFYGGMHRLAWGAVLAWVVFACHNGYGGIVNEFLSHPVWQPISRLTYTTYLVVLPLQSLIYFNTSHGGAFYFTHLNTLMYTVANVILSLPCAALVSLMAESPIVGLEKLLLRPSHTNAPSKLAGEGKDNANTSSSLQDQSNKIDTEKITSFEFTNNAFTVEDNIQTHEAGKGRNEAATLTSL